MSIERDQGFSALQRGDLNIAIPLLETACRNNPNDFYACTYLGGAYGQTNRAGEAIDILTRAVQLQPANPQARYNLAIALERGGWPQEAITAMQQALTLQPNYPQAAQALQRMQGTPPQTPAPSTPPNPSTFPQNPGLGSYAQAPAQPSYGTSGGAMPPSQGYAPPSPYGAPYAMPNPAAPASYIPQYMDSFDLGQAFRDWLQTVIAPGRFFDEQVGREGLKAPKAVLLAYALTFGVVSLLAALIHSGNSSPLGAVIGIPFYYLLFILSVYVNAWLLHNGGKWFSSMGSYAGAFRASAYSAGPSMLVSSLGILLIGPSGVSTQGAAMASIGLYYLLLLIGMLWGQVLLVIALSKIQRISPGAALGVTVVAFFVVCTIAFGVFVLGLLTVLAVAGARAAH